MHTPNQREDIIIPRDVIARAVELTKQNGGSTISLKGEIPTDGFSFAPSKATETPVPVDQFNEKTLTDYCGMMYDRFGEEGAHIGTWKNGENIRSF